jgi:hypothetical protein
LPAFASENVLRPSFRASGQERDMAVDRLPARFPVGTHYVVEGVPGVGGELTITSRYVMLPNGTEIPLSVTPQRLVRQMARRTAAARTAPKRSTGKRNISRP